MDHSPLDAIPSPFTTIDIVTNYFTRFHFNIILPTPFFRAVTQKDLNNLFFPFNRDKREI